MGFKDVFKNSFINSFTQSEVTTASVLASFIICGILATYIFFVYRKITKNTFYSKTFNISLVALAIIIDAIILTIQSNIVISLGMVGALSIVRFRTAIKDPMDLTFLFWSISIGIICGANLPKLAIVESLILTILILVLDYMPLVKASMLLIVNFNKENDEKEILNIIGKYAKRYKIKSRNISTDGEEMIVELRIKEESNIIKRISSIEGVTSASLISHDGDATF